MEKNQTNTRKKQLSDYQNKRVSESTEHLLPYFRKAWTVNLLACSLSDYTLDMLMHKALGTKQTF